MRKLYAVLMLMVAMLFVPLIAEAGDGVFASGKNATFVDLDQGRIIQFECTVDAVDTLTSNVFTLAKYDKDSFATYPIPFGYIANSVAGNVKMTVIFKGSYDNVNYFLVDTLFKDMTSEVYAKGTDTIENIKCPYYKLEVWGLSGNNADATFKLRLYLYRARDEHY